MGKLKSSNNKNQKNQFFANKINKTLTILMMKIQITDMSKEKISQQFLDFFKSRIFLNQNALQRTNV